MKENLQTHIKKIHDLEKDRIFWLKISGFVAVLMISLIASWEFITDNKINWTLISLGLIISAIWWYWTMKIIREHLKLRKEEIDILQDIVFEIKEIKKTIDKS